MISFPVISACAGAAAVVLAATARAEPVAVTASAVSNFRKLSASTTFGPFDWRGGLSLSSDDEDFGGLSGLTLSGNCEDLIAVSDAGRWFKAKLTYDGSTLAGISAPEMSPMLDSKGRPQRNKIWADAEAIATLSPGKVAVAYEYRVRIGTYDIGTKGLKAPFRHIAYPVEIDDGPDNGEIEALGLLPSGSLIAIAERQRDSRGNPRAWAWRGKSSVAFSIERYGDYNITDLAVLPSGSVLTIERSFSNTSLPGMAVRRFSSAEIASNATMAPELLFEGRLPFYAIDNMEGIATCVRDGETRVTLMSDNNFNTSLQSTLLLQFALRE